MRRTSAWLLGAIGICWVATAAAQGTPQSARDEYFRGSSHYTGVGAERDYDKAEDWLKRAAERGYARAQTALGKLYDDARAGKQNYTEAEKWYRRAALQGDPEAQYFLGYLYQIGRVVPPDPVEAWKWFNLSADRGYDEGRKYRDRIARDLTPAQVREGEARSRAWKPKAETQK